jgi:hypothetical protein
MLRDRLPFLLPTLLLGGVAAAVLSSRADAGPGHAPLGTAPDLIVGDIQDFLKYGTSGGLSSYAFGTTSCNIGDETLTWNANTNNHPVISGTVYRLKDGVLEQLGINWLKHGFSTLNQNLCGTCQPTNGTKLGIGCSDPYSASLNGQQSNLGPRMEVNAYDGFFPYPPTLNPTGGVLGGRVQLANGDIDPALNGTARYFVEVHYIHPEDSALIGNGTNNVSYREIDFTGTTAPYNVTFVAPTVRQSTVIEAWQAIDPSLTLTEFNFTGDGGMFLASSVTQLSATSWKYVYALYNRDSDRGARALGVPVAVSAAVTNRTFRDIAYHSGETALGTDWAELDGPVSSVPRAIGWMTGSWNQNTDNNGLRWGTTYTMSFTCDRAPVSGQAAVVGFKNGVQTYLLVNAQIPQ